MACKGAQQGAAHEKTCYSKIHTLTCIFDGKWEHHKSAIENDCYHHGLPQVLFKATRDYMLEKARDTKCENQVRPQKIRMPCSASRNRIARNVCAHFRSKMVVESLKRGSKRAHSLEMVQNHQTDYVLNLKIKTS